MDSNYGVYRFGASGAGEFGETGHCTGSQFAR